MIYVDQAKFKVGKEPFYTEGLFSCTAMSFTTKDGINFLAHLDGSMDKNEQNQMALGIKQYLGNVVNVYLTPGNSDTRESMVRAEYIANKIGSNVIKKPKVMGYQKVGITTKGCYAITTIEDEPISDSDLENTDLDLKNTDSDLENTDSASSFRP